MDHLSKLEAKSIYLIREAYHQYKKMGILWSIGKDSTTLMWLCRKAFFGEIPFPTIHIDTTHKFQAIYDFRAKYAKEWNLDLVISKNEEALAKGVGPDTGRFECCNQLKTEALKQLIAKNGYEALIVGIRRDEHGIRAKERYFSPRNEKFEWNYRDQPPELWDQYKSKSDDGMHLRIHPLLHWTELDIWKYIKRENIPVVELYLAKEGKRFRSIGCECCCNPVSSEAADVDTIIDELENTKESERSGRIQDKEKSYMMQKLRSLGYM